MKKIIVLGATGRIGKLLVPLFENSEFEVTAYVRDVEKAKNMGLKNVSYVEGDVLDKEKLTLAISDKDIVVAVLSGDLLEYTENIVSALKKSNVSRIIWVTGMGIHHEVPGEVGKMLDELCRQMPEYIQAADNIVNSGTPYTLIRAAHLTDGQNGKYYVHHEGENLHSNSVDRIAVANFIADLVKNEEGINSSLGVTN